MGMFKDLRSIMKSAKDVQKQHGGKTGIRDALSQGADMMEQAKGALSGNQEQAEIAANGRDGTATIGAVRETHMTLNEVPYLEFDLGVTVGGFGPYPVTIQQAVSRPSVPRLQPGAEVNVKVSPDDPNRVVMVAGDS